jgi:hypothetical protein
MKTNTSIFPNYNLIFIILIPLSFTNKEHPATRRFDATPSPEGQAAYKTAARPFGDGVALISATTTPQFTLL